MATEQEGSGQGSIAQTGMGHMAPLYDTINKVLFSLFLTRERTVRQATAKLAQIQAGESVLEVGCGTGSLTLVAKQWAGADGQVVGVDLSPEMLDVARRKADRAGAEIEFWAGSVDQMPFADGQFDVALASFMIYHMGEATRRAGLSEIRRVLRPGGRIIIVDLEPPTRQPAKAWAAFWIGHVLGAQVMLQHSMQELVPVMQAAGFVEVTAGVVGPSWLGFARGRC